MPSDGKGQVTLSVPGFYMRGEYDVSRFPELLALAIQCIRESSERRMVIFVPEFAAWQMRIAKR